VLSHHGQQASDDQNQTEHGQMLSSSTLLLNFILLIEVTFSTPAGNFTNYHPHQTVWHNCDFSKIIRLRTVIDCH